MKLKNSTIHEQMQQYPVAGLSLAIIRNGKLDYAEGFGLLETGTARKVTVNSVFNACSISKFLTAMLVLKLTDQGMLDLDENVNKKLVSWKIPENEFTCNKKVTIRNLLSHQSGNIDPSNSFDLFHPAQGKPTMLELLQGNTPYCPLPIEASYEPESEFHYSDAGFCILEQLIEDVTGKSFERLVKEFIFESLNMEHSTLESPQQEGKYDCFACGHNKKGHLVDERYPFYPYPAASGLWSTPTDLAALVIEVIQSLQESSKLGISPNIIKEMISPQGCSRWTGLGLFLDTLGQELEITSLGWGVGFQCMIVAYPHKGTGAVIMTNSDLGVHQMEGIIGDIIRLLDL